MFKLAWSAAGLYLVCFGVYLFFEPAVLTALAHIHYSPPETKGTLIGLALIRIALISGVAFLVSDYVRHMYRRLFPEPQPKPAPAFIPTSRKLRTIPEGR